MDMVLERVRAANPVQAPEGDYEDLFRAIVATEGDPRLARRRLPRITGMRLALVALIVFLVLAGVATATYFALGGSTGLGFVRTKDGAIAVVDRKGRTREIWKCPARLGFCGEIVSVAWSPDGKRLALSTVEVTASSNYPGLHIIDLKTGADRRISAVPRYVRTASGRTLRREFLNDIRTLGCYGAADLDWSPDGSRLAYSCGPPPGSSGRWRSRIYTIRPDGTGRRLISTPHIQDAFAPDWSPDGRSIAFSTCGWPPGHDLFKDPNTHCHSSVYVVDRDGRHLRRLAAGAFPDWSPSGRTIAYVAPVCARAGVIRARIRLVTPSGRDATPSSGRCAGIGPPHSIIPAWSPDGGRIAVATRDALYVMNADGSGLERFLHGNFKTLTGGRIKPLWQPAPK